MRLSDDWQGADFIAQHKDGEFLKVQLKGRLSFYKKYQGKDIYISFPSDGAWYIFSHDQVLEKALALHVFGASSSWVDAGGYSFPSIQKELKELLAPYRVSGIEQ